MLPTEEARLRRWPRHNCAPSGCAPTHAICWPPRNPHRPRPTKQRPSSPRFPPCEAFERQPPAARPTVVQGAGVRNPSALIPIGRAPPNSALPPRGFLLARLSNASPRRLAQPSCKGPASETLQHYPHRPRPTKQRPSSPRFPPCEAFERQPPAARPTVVQGAGVRNPSALPGSKSTPHDRRRASPLATSIAFPSSRAPEHKSADLVTSEDPLRPLRQRQTRTCSRPKRLVFVAGPVTTARRRAARRRMRSAGHLEIPIGRAPPNSALPPRGFLLARLSNASPRRLAQPSCKGPASETLQHYPDQNRHLMTVAAHLPSQPRSLSLPAARRSTRALTSSRPKIRFDRCVNAKPAHAPDRRGSSSSLAPSQLRAVGLRADACDLLAT